MNLKAGFKQTDWMRKEYVPFRKQHEQNVSRGEDGGGKGKNENHSLGGSGVMEGGEAGGEQVFLPDCGGLGIPAREFWVVFVRQWVDWKESELEKWLDLGRLVPRQWVE